MVSVFFRVGLLLCLMVATCGNAKATDRDPAQNAALQYWRRLRCFQIIRAGPNGK